MYELDHIKNLQNIKQKPVKTFGKVEKKNNKQTNLPFSRQVVCDLQYRKF